MDFSKFISLDNDFVADTEEKLGTFSTRYTFLSTVDRFKLQIETICNHLDFLDKKDVYGITQLCEKTPKIKHLSPLLFVLGWCVARGFETEVVFQWTQKLSEMYQCVLNEPSVIRYSRFIKNIQSGNTFNFTVLPNEIL
jgi:hypothetical protein